MYRVDLDTIVYSRLSRNGTLTTGLVVLISLQPYRNFENKLLIFFFTTTQWCRNNSPNDARKGFEDSN